MLLLLPVVFPFMKNQTSVVKRSTINFRLKPLKRFHAISPIGPLVFVISLLYHVQWIILIFALTTWCGCWMFLLNQIAKNGLQVSLQILVLVFLACTHAYAFMHEWWRKKILSQSFNGTPSMEKCWGVI